MILAGCTSSEEGAFSGTRLAPCSAEGTVFATIPFRNWATTYHTTVERILEEHVESLRTISTADLRCTESTLLSTLKPSATLEATARALAPWKSPASLAKLSQLHAGPVLKELLRVYECANLERGRSLSVNVQSQTGGLLTMSGSIEGWIARGPFDAEVAGQAARIERELRIARPTLERALAVTGSLDDLRGVSVEIECMKRLSRDMANVAGLTADTFSCLRRVPGKASLRDLSTAK